MKKLVIVGTLFLLLTIGLNFTLTSVINPKVECPQCGKMVYTSDYQAHQNFHSIEYWKTSQYAVSEYLSRREVKIWELLTARGYISEVDAKALSEEVRDLLGGLPQ